ncbi:glycolate oxidase subunit GlcE [Sulfuricystis multivorans]|uniref:glycolate oxidase subunit GlcE n=1 Tax=Sulfuricystis multivorans TaxID=2211108 RepID=UPI000F824058|nr:glycolate oxidase subunit GlcE [Sulfuricystis multivorans]
MNDLSQRFIEHVKSATAPLCIRGAGSKDWYGNAPRGEVLEVRAHRGIVAYEPSELVITARAGTPLAEIEAVLAQKGQCLPFEPPRFSADSTIGGVVAAGLSGPRRVSAGSLRDYLLGVKLIDGQGHELVFGGQVMKNVAGYDVARLMAGSLGTLGLLLEVSLKVMPRPVAVATVRFALSQAEALERLNRWAAQPLPIVASAWHESVLTLKLAGARAAVEAACAKLGADDTADDGFWDDLRDQRLPFFAAETLWRLSVPPTTPPLDLPGESLIEWRGGLRWLKTDLPAEMIRAAAATVGGHATLWRAPPELKERIGAFAPLPAPLLTLHKNLKAAFDPRGIFNPGRLYPEL